MLQANRMIADVAIRLATEADAVDIAMMSRDYIEHGLPWRWGPSRVAGCVRDAATNVAVIGGPGAVRAFGIMFYADDDAHLLLLAVRTYCQRQGLASALLVWLESVARSAGAKRIRVEARRDNIAARNFYSEHGYHERSISKLMYSGVLDGVKLEKWLRHDD